MDLQEFRSQFSKTDSITLKGFVGSDQFAFLFGHLIYGLDKKSIDSFDKVEELLFSAVVSQFTKATRIFK
jgi:hypothetical protein